MAFCLCVGSLTWRCLLLLNVVVLIAAREAVKTSASKQDVLVRLLKFRHHHAKLADDHLLFLEVLGHVLQVTVQLARLHFKFLEGALDILLIGFLTQQLFKLLDVCVSSQVHEPAINSLHLSSEVLRCSFDFIVHELDQFALELLEVGQCFRQICLRNLITKLLSQFFDLSLLLAHK